MSENVIDVKNVYKKFKIYDDFFVDRVKETFFFWNSKKYYKDFLALDNVNLTVKKGEVLGLIGPNGAGKSTLLKLLAKISYATSGEINIKGSLVAVLSLGLGFNPRFTGRENILVGGILLGMNIDEIKKKEEWIIDFSELKDFIDKPIRSYSSGMLARLSFSVAAAVSPEILIIDEALATGDSFFVQKSLGRIHEICKEGTTAIFVSHNLQQIQRLCSERVVLLEKGRIVNDGPAKDVIKHYNDLIFKYMEQNALKKNDNSRSSKLNSMKGTEGQQEVMQGKVYHGNGDIVIEKIRFIDNDGNQVLSIKTGEKLTMYFDYNAEKDVNNVKLIVTFENYSGICAYGFQSNSYYDKKKEEMNSAFYKVKKGKGSFEMIFDPILFTTNKYLITVYIYDESKILSSDSDFYQETLFIQYHMAELSVFKTGDLNTTLICEHPIEVNLLQE